MSKDHTHTFLICREENYGTLSIFFDLAGTGMKNLDLDYTKQIVHILKCYYPNNLNYIFVYELPWILTGNCLSILYMNISIDQMH